MSFDDILSQIEQAKLKQQGKPYNKRHVPTKPYVSFDDYFRQEVARFQEEVEKLRLSRVPYMAIADALKATETDYPQIFNIVNDNTFIIAKADLLSDQHYTVFDRLVQQVTANLNNARDRNDEPPNPSLWSDVEWRWRYTVGEKTYIVKIMLEVPPAGNMYRSETMKTEYMAPRPASSYQTIIYEWNTLEGKE